MSEHWQVTLERNNRHVGLIQDGLIVNGDIDAWLAEQGAKQAKAGHYSARGWRIYVRPLTPETLARVAAIIGSGSAAAQALVASA